MSNDEMKNLIILRHQTIKQAQMAVAIAVDALRLYLNAKGPDTLREEEMEQLLIILMELRTLEKREVK